MKNLLKVISAIAICCAMQTASAGVITSLYGDVTGTYDGSADAGTITDRGLGGSQSWTQTFSIPVGTVTSATIRLGYAALGYYPPAGVPRLFLDSVLVGNLRDMDQCDGSAAPGVSSCSISNYTVELLPANAAYLLDGVANLYIETGSGDGWFLDFSEITITSVPEPATTLLIGAALLGLGAARSKKQQRA